MFEVFYPFHGIFLVILHAGHSVIWIFNGNFSAECAVLPQSIRIAAIPDNAIASGVSFRDLMIAKKKIEMRKVFPVPQSSSKKYNQLVLLVIACIVLSYAMRCSGTKFRRILNKFT
ncbi:hypothetical protein TNIN_113001 [Trichonephila inaurata madagascariensis]|uniref:Uncharacterized protein n=1 Tax=Trichonephila inaurata madagascariensis TaxID=2747483 RepID=A0A8X6JKE7_9ARAC|nr:hypothetical protein TNIN_113001 [Trichonephila inaurata madagascariensis]